MGRFELTIRDPLSEIPDLVLSTFGKSGYSRSEMQRKSFSEWTAYGTAVLQGPAGGVRYVWAIAVTLSETESLHFGKLQKAQDRRANPDRYLTLIDEYEYLDPEPAPHSKDLLSGSVETDADDYEWGFGVFKVRIDLPPKDPKTHVGRSLSGSKEPFKLIQFVATEVGPLL